MNFQEILKLDHIVFYDGECGFCNRIVKFILKYRKVDFYFIALQSKTAQDLLAKYNVKMSMNTLYLIENRKLYDKSSAGLRILKGLESFYPILFFIGNLFPKRLRDFIYMKISKYRHQIHPQSCILPRQAEQKFFIA